MDLYVTEKPSVAMEFAKVLHANNRKDGYMEGNGCMVTWCVGHLLTLKMPQDYDEKYAKWNIDDLPFLPEEYSHVPISSVKKQLKIVTALLKLDSVTRIYNCGDSAQEGELIQCLVYRYAGVYKKKQILRVWIDSQTEDEIRRGIKEAKDDVKYYENLFNAGLLRQMEDFTMGINYSRALTLKYRDTLKNCGITENDKPPVIQVGRVKTCVLAMVVRREREIASFKEMPFYRIAAAFENTEAMWKLSDGSRYAGKNSILYKTEGILDKKEADSFKNDLNAIGKIKVTKIEKNIEKKAPPLLYNLAELQADCSKILKITPDETLACAQELYEKKLTTYPRTDARVITKAVAKVVHKNINGLTALSDFSDERLSRCAEMAKIIMEQKLYEGIEKKKYVNDKKVSDHYAIIPTGQIADLKDVKALSKKVYQLIVERFLQIFYGPVSIEKMNVTAAVNDGHHIEEFALSTKKVVSEGWYCVKGIPDSEKQATKDAEKVKLEEGATYNASFDIKSGKTTPPKRYDSGSIILAMENAGNLIDDEELREQIKGSGIGTSATRANIIKDLVKQNMLKINKKTQIITPTLKGEGVYEVVLFNIKTMLSAEMTANWDMGLSYVAKGKLKKEEFRGQLETSVRKYVDKIKKNDYSKEITNNLKIISKRYKR